MKKDRWLPLKEMLFTYLAISKVLYWVDTIMALEQRDLGHVGEAVVQRLLNQDIMLISGVILFYCLDKLIAKKFNSGKFLEYVVFYAAGFVGMIGLLYLYLWIMSWFVTLEFPPLGAVVSNFSLGYIAVIVVLNIKYYMKAKEKETHKDTPSTQDADSKLAMLKALLDGGVLTKEEFETKKKNIRNG